MRHTLAYSCLILCLMVMINPLHAQGILCAELRSQLASLPPEGGNGSLVQQQLSEIQKARGDLQRLNCGSAESQANRDKIQTCERVSDALESMEQNYIRLSRSAGNNRTAAIRADLLAQIKDNGCDRPSAQAQQQQAPRGDQEGNFLTWLFGRIQNKPPSNGVNPQQQMINPEMEGQVAIGGALRTLCVRKCDGYYWPVSFATSSRAFERDAEACQAMCPTQETELFYHHVQGQWSDDMVSTKGTPYKSMSYAFNYRTAYNPACSCRPTTKAEKNASVFDWKPNQAGNSGNGISQAPLSPLNKEAVKAVSKSETAREKLFQEAIGFTPETRPVVNDGALAPVQQASGPALSTPQNLGVDIRTGGGSNVDYNALREVPRAR